MGSRFSGEHYADGGMAIYGDGSDGDVTITGGTTTLAINKYYNNLIIDATGVLKPANFLIFVRDTLTLAGDINFNGVAASTSNNTGGGPLASVGYAGGAGAGAGGGAGSNGGNSAAVGYGGSGGNGGSNGGANAGGTGGAMSLDSASRGQMRSLIQSLHGSLTAASGSARFDGGGGGGGGGSTAGSTGGAGGSGGGSIVIAARRIVMAGGTLRSLGGAGGAGAGAAGGGGGGGGGGIIVLHYDYFSGTLPTAAVNCAGGALGAKAGTGVDGVAGSTGKVILIKNRRFGQ